jgi:phosphomannomutase
MIGTPNESLDTLNMSMFKAYDIRTPAKYLTLDLAKRLAVAEVAYFREILKTNTVILCRDARLTGEEYLRIGQETFCEFGFEVLVTPEIQTTCHFYYCCMRNPGAAGIIYGASHNPGEDTGQKIVGPGVKPIAMNCGPEKGLLKIAEFYTSGYTPERLVGGVIKHIDYLNDYISYSMRLAGINPGDLKGCRILMDFLHGAAGKEFIRAFTQAGAVIEHYHAKPDGSFPIGPPNPVVPQTIAEGLQALKEGDFQLGMFFDGDGDRLDIYSTDGALLSPSFNMSIIAKELQQISIDQSDKPIPNPFIYACLKASPIALKSIASYDIDCKVIRNGHSQIKQALNDNVETGCIAAVEESAHYYMNFPFDGEVYSSENTLFFGLLTAKIWYQSSDLYHQAFKTQKELYRNREWGYKFPNDKARDHALKAVEEAFLKRGGQSINRTEDGLDLEATLMRRDLPFSINQDTIITERWVQIAQRVSQSEKGLARWEVSAGQHELKTDMVKLINDIVGKFTSEDNYIG